MGAIKNDTCSVSRLSPYFQLLEALADQHYATVCIGHEVMRATNSWAVNWDDESDGQKSGGLLVMGHQLGE